MIVSKDSSRKWPWSSSLDLWFTTVYVVCHLAKDYRQRQLPCKVLKQFYSRCALFRLTVVRCGQMKAVTLVCSPSFVGAHSVTRKLYQMLPVMFSRWQYPTSLFQWLPLLTAGRMMVSAFEFLIYKACIFYLNCVSDCKSRVECNFSIIHFIWRSSIIKSSFNKFVIILDSVTSNVCRLSDLQCF